MISAGSCGTEDWSNDAEYSVFNHKNKLHMKKYSNWKVILICTKIVYHSITALIPRESKNWSNMHLECNLSSKCINVNITKPQMRREEIRRYTPGFPPALRAALTLDHRACEDKKENRNKEFNTKYISITWHIFRSTTTVRFYLCVKRYSTTSLHRHIIHSHTASSV